MRVFRCTCCIPIRTPAVEAAPTNIHCHLNSLNRLTETWNQKEASLEKKLRDCTNDRQFLANPGGRSRWSRRIEHAVLVEAASRHREAKTDSQVDALNAASQSVCTCRPYLPMRLRKASFVMRLRLSVRLHSMRLRNASSPPKVSATGRLSPSPAQWRCLRCVPQRSQMPTSPYPKVQSYQNMPRSTSRHARGKRKGLTYNVSSPSPARICNALMEKVICTHRNSIFRA